MGSNINDPHKSKCLNGDDNRMMAGRQSKMTKKKKLFQKIKEVPSLTKYVVFSISIVMIYSVLDIVLQCHNITLSDTLTTCVYGFFGGEVITCALIKIFKLRENGSDVEGGGYEVID